MGTRVAEIQELTNNKDWCYVDSLNNPADDITRGKTLLELAGDNRWTKGPSFLWLSPKNWPNTPTVPGKEDSEELRKHLSCLNIVTDTCPSPPDPKEFHCFTDLVKATAEYLHKATPSDSQGPTAETCQKAELEILKLPKERVSPR